MPLLLHLMPVQVDVAIVGGGLAGLATAVALHKVRPDAKIKVRVWAKEGGSLCGKSFVAGWIMHKFLEIAVMADGTQLEVCRPKKTLRHVAAAMVGWQGHFCVGISGAVVPPPVCKVHCKIILRIAGPLAMGHASASMPACHALYE